MIASRSHRVRQLELGEGGDAGLGVLQRAEVNRHRLVAEAHAARVRGAAQRTGLAHPDRQPVIQPPPQRPIVMRDEDLHADREGVIIGLVLRSGTSNHAL